MIDRNYLNYRSMYCLNTQNFYYKAPNNWQFRCIIGSLKSLALQMFTLDVIILSMAAAAIFESQQ
jgi:hypothetical protein